MSLQRSSEQVTDVIIKIINTFHSPVIYTFIMKIVSQGKNLNRFVCGIDSECQNYPGSYRCVCKPGFKHRGRSCVDINECEEIPNICSHECVNLWGSYRSKNSGIGH